MKIIILILILITTLFSNENLEQVSLQLKWKYQFQFAGFIVAKEKGFYKEEGLNVEFKEFDIGIDIVTDVETGKTDFGVSDTSLVYHALRDKPISALMVIFQESPSILMGLKSSKIQKLQDLHREKLALYEGRYGIAVKTMLKANNINYIERPPIFNLDKLISGEINMMTAYISNEPYMAKEKNIEVITFTPKDYGFEGYGDILFTSKDMINKAPEVVERMYKASYKGWNYAFSHIDEVVDLIYEKYNTLDKTKEALKYEAEILKELSGYGKNFGELSVEKIKSIAQLFNLVQNENHKLSLLDDFIYQQNKPKTNLTFTAAEEAYLKNKKTINVCVKSLNEPFNIKKGQNYSGLSIDFLNIISKKTKLGVNYIYNTTIKEYFNGIESGECDLVSLVLTKPNTFNFLTPTIPYGSDKIVLATKIDEPYLYDLRSLKDEKIMMLKGENNAIKYIKSLYPNLNIIEVDQLDLKRVNSGEFYGCIHASYLLLYHIEQAYVYDIKIMIDVGGKRVEGSFGISNKEPLLLSIFNKSIEQIPSNVQHNISTSYRNVKVEKHINYMLIMQVIAIALLVIVIVIILYLREKKLSNAIKKEKNKFKNIFYRASDGTSILTDGVFTECNDSLVRLLGYNNKKQVLNLTPSELSPEYQPDGEKSFDKSIEMLKIAKEQGINHFEWKHIKANSEVFWADIMLTNISTSDNETVLHVVWRDIQHRKELEVKLIELNSSLENKIKKEVEKNKQHQLIMLQQSRHAQMGEMISMIAHQWRQPLNNLSMIIQGASLKYKLGKFDDALMLKLSTDSQKQIMQMSQTIDDFRNFFKPDKLAKVFNINTTIQHVAALLKPMLDQASIEVETHLEDDLSIKGFSNELVQALINIINNAKDVLTANKHREKKIITITLKQEDGMVIISIGDNGGGIPDDIIDQIFDPYFSTKEGKNGTGLGLYMSRNIIEEHCQGQMSVKNGRDGAIFKIVLGGVS